MWELGRVFRRRVAANIAQAAGAAEAVGVMSLGLLAGGCLDDYRSGFGFHSRAKFCASAICAGVILEATLSRCSTASAILSCEAARLSHMYAYT